MAHTVAVIVGSLRKESFTLKIANALGKLAPPSLKLETVTLHGLSFFNQDLEANPPADWVSFREKIQASDAVLFVTPEYNRSIPGVLKNAIDVGSRPSGQSSFKTKPIGIVANSPGPLGGVSAAMNLKQSLPGYCGPILQQPEIYLNGVGDAFDDKGNLTKEALQKVLKQYIDAYAAHVERHRAVG
jgi:chromate reductase